MLLHGMCGVAAVVLEEGSEWQQRLLRVLHGVRVVLYVLPQ